MARVTGSAVMGQMSGTFGTSVLAQTQDGITMRARPTGNKHRSPAQMAQDARMWMVNRAWDLLTGEEARAWRSYALSLAARNAATGGLRVPSAYGLFAGLSTKYLQIHGGATVPSLPPAGPFKGDLLAVTAEGAGEDIVFTSDKSNQPGVLTELLAQRLSGPNNLPKTKSYVSRGFVTFAAGVPVSVPIGRPGIWALAIRFVEASSGRMTEVTPIGQAQVTHWFAEE